MSLKFEPASEPLHISVKQLGAFGSRGVIALLLKLSTTIQLWAMHEILLTTQQATGNTFEPKLDPFLQFVLGLVTLRPDISARRRPVDLFFFSSLLLSSLELSDTPSL